MLSPLRCAHIYILEGLLGECRVTVEEVEVRGTNDACTSATPIMILACMSAKYIKSMFENSGGFSINLFLHI